MAGSGRIYQRGRIYFIAYSHGGQEFRESVRSEDIEDAKRLLATRLGDVQRPASEPAQSRLCLRSNTA
jgi:hypothetical protein